MKHQLHLVRHGEVSNPNHVVYGDLPGFHLSPLGVLQAHSTGRHLAGTSLDIVLSSPLSRALETATAIARHHDLTPRVDARLTESGQFPHWTGHRWEELSDRFPGELDGYLSDATSVSGAESIAQVAQRYVSVVESALLDGHHAIVVVGHQDTVQAARLELTGRPLSELRQDPPDHAEVVTLSKDGISGWTDNTRWHPAVTTV